MQKWEYLEVWHHDYQWVDSLGRSGRLPQAWNVPMAAGLLNELGEQGWELLVANSLV